MGKTYKSTIKYIAVPGSGFGSGSNNSPYMCFGEFQNTIELEYTGTSNIAITVEDRATTCFMSDPDMITQWLDIGIGDEKPDTKPNGTLIVKRQTELLSVQGFYEGQDFINRFNAIHQSDCTSIAECGKVLYPDLNETYDVSDLQRQLNFDQYGYRWYFGTQVRSVPDPLYREAEGSWYYRAHIGDEYPTLNNEESNIGSYLSSYYDLSYDTDIYLISQGNRLLHDINTEPRYLFTGEESSQPGVSLPTNKKGDSDDDEDPDDWEPTDKSGDSSTTIVNPTGTPLKCAGAMNNYVIDEGQCADLFEWFWNGMIEQARTDDTLAYLTGVFGDMGQCLTGIMMYPFNAPKGNRSQMVLGRFNSEIIMDELGTGSNRVFDCKYKIPRMNNSFLDYAPYNKLMIYLPYIGLKELDTNTYVGQTIKIEYFVDFTNGGLDVFLYRNNAIMDQFSGKIGAEVPFTLDSGKSLRDKAADAAMQTGVDMIGSVVGGAISAAGGGGAGSMIGDAIDDFTSNITADGTQNVSTRHYSTVSNNANIMNSPKQVMLFQIYPSSFIEGLAKNNSKRQAFESKYAQTYGNVYMNHKKLENVTGYTVCQNVKLKFGHTKTSDDTEVNPTAEEQIILKQLLESGVYL